MGTNQSGPAIIRIRKASEEDAAALLRIYAPYILTTAITFEYTVPSCAEFAKRIREIGKRFPFLVAENEKEIIVGYIYASPFKARAAYAWAVEISIYVDMQCRKQGIGRQLHEALEKKLKEMGILNLNACISYSEKENEYLTHASVEFHKALGYSQVGQFHKIGKKFSRWFDIVWMEKLIGRHEEKK